MENILTGNWVKKGLDCSYRVLWGGYSRLVGPSRKIDDLPPRWWAQVHDAPTRRVDVLVVPDDRRGLHMLAAIAQGPDICVLNPGRHMGLHVFEARDYVRFLRKLNPLYRVTCYVDHRRQVDAIFAPYTCVLAVRALLGIDVSVLSYPEQLLRYLWEE